MSGEDVETVLILRNYIHGCISRAKWYRDEGKMQRGRYENMLLQVQEARRLSNKVREIVHQETHR